MYNLIRANFALHITLDAEEQQYVESILQRKLLKKHSYLLEAGDTCKSIYFVNKGCLRMFYQGEDASEHNISFLPEFWWAVDISSFANQRPAFYSISALEDTELLYLSFAALEELYVRVPKFERFFRILTQNGFNLYQDRITTSLSKSAEERYAVFQHQYPGLENRIAQKHIASYLGITPVFLSMLRHR